jgi:hypothetical protein
MQMQNQATSGQRNRRYLIAFDRGGSFLLSKLPSNPGVGILPSSPAPGLPFPIKRRLSSLELKQLSTVCDL